jgi:hypothetical protein
MTEILDGERSAFAEFLAMALDIIETDMQRVESSLVTRDVAVLADAAHRLLKGRWPRARPAVRS